MLAVLVAATLVHAVHHSVYFEDIHAFPKYAVHFLNALPIDNHTALSWLTSGHVRELDHFLDLTPPSTPPPLDNALLSPDDEDTHHTSLQLMRLSPEKAFLCFIPRPPPVPPPFAEDSADMVPASKSWKQLAALSGSCLYHRQGWFTYSYCHNLHVRQFREVAHSHPQPGLQVPEEDEKWESFTLGRSPTADLDNALLNIDESAAAQNVQVARGARQRYLVQKWGDGTMCDKTGRSREIEIQFHCSASIMDSIMFVKETSTCKYVLVVHTPRLCGEPGFKSRIDQTADAPIRCREIVDKINPKDERSLTSSRHPVARVINSLGGSKQETIAKSEKKPKKVAVEDDKISFLKKLIEGMVLRGSKEVDVPAQLLNMDEADPEQIWVVDGEDALTKLVDNMRGSKAKSKEAQRNAANEEEDDDSENTERTPRDEL